MFIPYSFKPRYQHHLRRGKCWKCKEEFQKGDRIVGLTFSYKEKMIRANYHWDCLKDMVDEWFKLNPFNAERRKRKGKTHPEFLQVRRRLVALRYYHMKHNNQDRVKQLSEQIDKITTT